MTASELVKKFAQTHLLPSSFCDSAEKYFVPLAEKLVTESQTKTNALFVGIHGCQGSGKSTLTDFLIFFIENYYDISVVGMSIDDFYLTKQERRTLADEIHPLFQTRGVPGTHDTSLLSSVLLNINLQNFPVAIPRFDKSTDDRFPKEDWFVVENKPEIILLEGWCIGVRPASVSSLAEPINKLEENEDTEGEWRAYSNESLIRDYSKIFSDFDQLVMLKAPGFFAVKSWRFEQEERLKAKLTKQGLVTDGLMSEQEVDRFIQHYQRITELALSQLPDLANVVFELNEQRNIFNHYRNGIAQ